MLQCCVFLSPTQQVLSVLRKQVDSFPSVVLFSELWKVYRFSFVLSNGARWQNAPPPPPPALESRLHGTFSIVTGSVFSLSEVWDFISKTRNIEYLTLLKRVIVACQETSRAACVITSVHIDHVQTWWTSHCVCCFLHVCIYLGLSTPVFLCDQIDDSVLKPYQSKKVTFKQATVLIILTYCVFMYVIKPITKTDISQC